MTDGGDSSVIHLVWSKPSPNPTDKKAWAKNKLSLFWKELKSRDCYETSEPFGIPNEISDEEAEIIFREAFENDERFAGSFIHWHVRHREIYVYRPNNKEVYEHPKREKMFINQ